MLATQTQIPRPPPNAVRSIARLCLALLAASCLCAGCDGLATHSLKVTGPTFVGFGYTPSVLEGSWSGTLSALDFFETANLKLDNEGMVTAGGDSRGVKVIGGKISFRNNATGELDLLFELDDGLNVQGLGFLVPGAASIQGVFAIGSSIFGELLLERVTSANPFAGEPASDAYTMRFFNPTFQIQRSGEVRFGGDGAVLSGSVIDDVPVASGQVKIIDPARGGFTLNLLNEDDETIFGIGFFCLVDGKAAGAFDAFLPSSEGFFTLTPIQPGSGQ